MKHIIKYSEPQALTDLKGESNAHWQPSYNDLSGDAKKAVKDALMVEQGYLCCYCERRLTDEDSHIEHFQPQSDPNVDPLDFANMLCSCQQQLKKGEPRHCGNLKEHWYDSSLLISPLDSDCESRFAFTGNGAIKPSLMMDTSATETIKRLGLNIPKLNALRASAIEPFLDDSLNEDDFQAFVSGYLKKDNKGLYGEFWTTIYYLFGGYQSV